MRKNLMVSRVDRAASRQAILDQGYTLRGWATARGINEGTLKQFFYGRYPRPNETGGPIMQTIFKELKKSKSLVLVSNLQEAA